MSVTYLKDEYVAVKLVPIAAKAIKQIIREIKDLSLIEEDTLRAIRGTVSVIVALSIEKSREKRSAKDEMEVYFKEVERILMENLG